MKLTEAVDQFSREGFGTRLTYVPDVSGDGGNWKVEAHYAGWNVDRELQQIVNAGYGVKIHAGTTGWAINLEKGGRPYSPHPDYSGKATYVDELLTAALEWVERQGVVK